MANDVRYNTKCHAGATPAERIQNRYKNSGGENRAATTVQTGTGRVGTKNRQQRHGPLAAAVPSLRFGDSRAVR